MSSSLSSSKKKSNSNNKKAPSLQPLRLLIKCSWSGARLLVPKVSPTTTLSEALSQLDLPPCVVDKNDGGCTMVYMRHTVPQSDWHTTRLSDLGVFDGSVLMTLSLPAADAVMEGSDVDGDPSDMQLDATPAADVETPKTVAVSDARNEAEAAVEPRGPSPSTSQATPEESIQQETVTAKKANKAIAHLLSCNFDSDSKSLLQTVLKIVDNILSSRDNKFRTLKLGNAALSAKIFSKRGGMDLMFALGFRYPIRGGDRNAVDCIVLTPDMEGDGSTLREARLDIVHVLLSEFSLPESDLPPPPPTLKPEETLKFDPFKAHMYNTQTSASTSKRSDNSDDNEAAYMSATERQLLLLKNKQEKLEQEMQTTIHDRELIAMLPGAFLGEADAPVGGGDKAFLANRMQRMEEERKKREDGTFTTKAMRDLEKIKKQKVYSHTVLRIVFSDSSSLSCKFLPSETITTVKHAIFSAFVPECRSMDLKFDLYAAPPRRILTEEKTLEMEGLVPAAKIHVSWNAGCSPSSSKPGSFLLPELFQKEDTNFVAFPSAKSVVDTTNNNADGVSDDKDDRKPKRTSNVSKEEEMMRRMLGKNSKSMFVGTLLGNRKKDVKDEDDEDDGNKKPSSNNNTNDGNKPKWFK